MWASLYNKSPVYEVSLEGIRPCNMKNRDIYWGRYKIQETLYIGQGHLSPLQSRHLGTSHNSPSHHELSHHIFPNLINRSEIPSLSKAILVLGKARSYRAPNLGSTGSESPGWFDVLSKNCTRCDAWTDVLLWWTCQLPFAHNSGFLNHPDSFLWGMFNINAKFDADLLLYWLSHLECNGHTAHMIDHSTHLLSHWRVQWCCHCSHMCIPVHSAICHVPLMLS